MKLSNGLSNTYRAVQAKANYHKDTTTPEIKIGNLEYPCNTKTSKGQIITRKMITFTVRPRSGYNPEAIQIVLDNFKKAIAVLQSMMKSDKYSVEDKQFRAENYHLAYEYFVTEAGHPELAPLLKECLCVSARQVALEKTPLPKKTTNASSNTSSSR